MLDILVVERVHRCCHRFSLNCDRPGEGRAFVVTELKRLAEWRAAEEILHTGREEDDIEENDNEEEAK